MVKEVYKFQNISLLTIKHLFTRVKFFTILVQTFKIPDFVRFQSPRKQFLFSEPVRPIINVSMNQLTHLLHVFCTLMFHVKQVCLRCLSCVVEERLHGVAVTGQTGHLHLNVLLVCMQTAQLPNQKRIQITMQRGLTFLQGFNVTIYNILFQDCDKETRYTHKKQEANFAEKQTKQAF